MRMMFKTQLAELSDIIQIRGQGLMIGIELSRPCGDLVREALSQGLLINVTSDRVVRLLPPLVMQRSEAEEVVNILSAIIREFLAGLTHSGPFTQAYREVCSRFMSSRTGSSIVSSKIMQIKHFLQFNDFSRDEFEYLFERTRWIKHEFKQYRRYWPLEDRTLAMIFDKHSTRTRLSFEAGMHQLGGAAIYLSTRDTQLGRGEPVEDAARVISRMVDIVMIRTYEHDIIRRFAAHSRGAGNQRID